jgi:hypothetical protein
MSHHLLRTPPIHNLHAEQHIHSFKHPQGPSFTCFQRHHISLLQNVYQQAIFFPFSTPTFSPANPAQVPNLLTTNRTIPKQTFLASQHVPTPHITHSHRHIHMFPLRPPELRLRASALPVPAVAAPTAVPEMRDAAGPGGLAGVSGFV